MNLYFSCVKRTMDWCLAKHVYLREGVEAVEKTSADDVSGLDGATNIGHPQKNRRTHFASQENSQV